MFWWVVVALVFLYSLLFVYKTKTGTPYVPTEDEELQKLLKYIKQGDVVADLGAGDGRVLLTAAEMGANEAWGWEIEPLVWLRGVIKIRKRSLQDKVKLKFGDMWSANLSKFDVVFVYQLEKYAERFARKCKKEMKPGSIVVVNRYPIKGLGEGERNGKLIIYKI